MTKLQHTHGSGGECLACDISLVRLMIEHEIVAKHARPSGSPNALDRIESALAEREPMCAEFGCGAELTKKYPPMCPEHWELSQERYEQNSERARKGEKG